MDIAAALDAHRRGVRPWAVRVTLDTASLRHVDLVRALTDVYSGSLPSAVQALARSRPIEINASGFELLQVARTLREHGIEADIDFA